MSSREQYRPEAGQTAYEANTDRPCGHALMKWATWSSLSDELKAHWATVERKVIAALSEGKGATEGEWVRVPREPTDGLLMSMAMRYDHGLGCPGYYDQPMFSGQGVTHKMRVDSAIRTMRQLHEEVVGSGFYEPERESEYVSRIITASPTGEDR